MEQNPRQKHIQLASIQLQQTISHQLSGQIHNIQAMKAAVVCVLGKYVPVPVQHHTGSGGSFQIVSVKAGSTLLQAFLQSELPFFCSGMVYVRISMFYILFLVIHVFITPSAVHKIGLYDGRCTFLIFSYNL